MSVEWVQPAPVLVVNDETGEWVMTHNITRVVVGKEGGALVFVRQDESAGKMWSTSSYVASPLTPQQLRERMFDMGEDDAA